MARNALWAALASAAFISTSLLSRRASAAVNPKVKGTPQVLGTVIDPRINRDSCGSVKFHTRALWVCRDTQPVNSSGIPVLPVWSSSASWSDFNSSGDPALTATSAGGEELLLYGAIDEEPFYPYQPDECDSNSAGECSDGTRFALWPDSPPMVTLRQGADGEVLGHTWVKQSHITADLGTVTPDPPTGLYRVTYFPESAANRSVLPTVTLVNETFWPESAIPYGDYGHVVRGGYAYVYGQPSTGIVALARVPQNCIEERDQYEFWVDGAWTSAVPGINQTGVALNATAGGQGTFYFSEPWNSYVWIGGPNDVGASFYITTAPEPEGPWTEPELFYQGVSGNYSLGAYSLQAHPALVPHPQDNEMYLTYTKNDVDAANVNVYTHPLILVSWD